MKKTVFTLALLGLALLAPPTFADEERWKCIEDVLTTLEDAEKFCNKRCEPRTWNNYHNQGWLKPGQMKNCTPNASACLCKEKSN